MKFSANPIPPSLEDVLMTAVQLATEELAEIYPQPEVSDSVGHWKKYLCQQALKRQMQLSEEQRFAYARDVLCTHEDFS